MCTNTKTENERGGLILPMYKTALTTLLAQPVYVYCTIVRQTKISVLQTLTSYY